MNWYDKLERKYSRYTIPNLISIVVAGQIIVYAVELFVNQYIAFDLSLYSTAILHGQIWRLLTFIFVPFTSGDPLTFAITAYFTWFIGSALERSWGSFRFDLYFLLGMLGAIAACFITGTCGTYSLSLSLFLAFAMLYPNMEVLLFFILPIRVKYLGYVSGGIWLLSFLTANLAGKINYLFGMAGFLAFFGPALWRNLRAWFRRQMWAWKNRR